MKSKFLEDAEYYAWLIELKSKIQSSQIKAAITVNKELLMLYWELGESISAKIKSTAWGEWGSRKTFIGFKKRIT